MPRCTVAAACVTAAALTSVGAHPPLGTAGQSVAAVGTLNAGTVLEKTASEGDTHTYEVLLNQNDYLELSATQSELVLMLTVQAPDGTTIQSGNVPDMDPMPQRLMFVAPVAGRYSIRVRAVSSKRTHIENVPAQGDSQGTAAHRYEVRVLALRPATSSDHERARWFEVLEGAVEHERRGDMDGLRQAVPLYQRAAAGWRSVGDVALEAETLEPLAHLTGYFTEYTPESIAARERLAEIYAHLGHAWLEVHNLRALGTEYLEAGRLEQARQAVTRALELSRAAGFRQSAAASVHQLCVYEFELGNYDRARELALEAQALASAIADSGVEALALLDLSRLDALAGDLDAAIARNTRALTVAAGNLIALTRINMWLGFQHLQRGDLDKAASYFETRLALAKKTVQRDSEALTRLGLGDVLLAQGDRDGARRRYEEAASALVRGTQPWRCIAEQRLARMALEDGDLDRANAGFETMRGIAATWRNAVCEAEVRAGFADLAARRGDLEAAEREATRVVELAETFRQAAISPESRALGFGALAPAYERAVDISMRRAERGDASAVARALTLNEQALARGLLDKVSESRLESRARLPAPLAEEHRRLRDRWRARLAELQVSIRTRPDAEETKALVEETRVLATQLHDLEARMDSADPRAARLLRPEPLRLGEVQALLDADTVLLEYALGRERSYLWVVSDREVRSFTLAPRARIEALARRVHERLAAPSRPAPAAEVHNRDPENDLRALSRIVIEPATAVLAKRIVLVLPGALSLVPFGALPGDGAEPLIDRHEILQVPSATMLQAMRALTAGRARPRRLAAVFADPVFDRDDPRVPGVASRPSGDKAQPAPRFAGVSLTRLPFSQGEAKAIASLAPTSVETFMGLDATRERALDGRLSDFRFIHFATHGIVNQDVPNLSSIVLSLVDGEGRPRDGFLMLPDVYDMSLNADLVVLSGCQTALGRQVRGEGPIGLSRAFMYAGVPRVVASLWKVDDLATAELMKRFYRGVLVEGLTPASALRAAQRGLARDRRWRSPYFWAPFILQGDWRWARRQPPNQPHPLSRH